MEIPVEAIADSIVIKMVRESRVISERHKRLYFY